MLPRAWRYVLSEQEAIETLILVGVLSAFCLWLGIAAADTGPVRIELPLGFYIDREVSIGNLAVGIAILLQVGRWGRRMATRFAHIPERLEHIEARVDTLNSIISRIDMRCPLRAREDAEQTCE
jgi:hypothetical protein